MPPGSSVRRRPRNTSRPGSRSFRRASPMWSSRMAARASSPSLTRSARPSWRSRRPWRLREWIADAWMRSSRNARRMAPGERWPPSSPTSRAQLSWRQRTPSHQPPLSLGRVAAPSSWRAEMGHDVVVVGAGFAGSVVAERLASQLGRRVLVLDRRDHVGGNAYDEPDDAGILIHRYGPHIFHTNSPDIFDYLSGFTEWRPYEHRVLAEVRGQLVPIPINRTTVNRLFGLGLRYDAAVERFYASRAERGERARPSDEVVVQGVGRELYELLFRGYTRKQWGLAPSQLDASVTARVPARTNDDDRYFPDRFQAMPAAGYTRMFDRLLEHPLIEVRTAVDFHDVEDELDYGQLVYTGPIDAYFDYRFGRLPYRSLRFEFETLSMARFQATGTVNYPDESVPFTRITEFKHLTGQAHAATTLVREFPTVEGDPYYPIPRPDNRALYERYAALAAATPGVEFVGRLATYKYYNMDQVVGQALAAYRRLATQLRDAA